MGNLTSLLNSGFDAFTNLYDVIITFPTNAELGELSNTTISVRALDFSPPELTVGTYQVDYKAIQLTRPNAKITGERTFDLGFRIDATYNLYKALLNWKHLFVDPSSEGNIKFGAYSNSAVTSDNANYGSIEVVGYNASGTLGDVADPTSDRTSIRWKFYDVFCLNVGSPSFTRAGSEAVTTTAKFYFGRMDEPETSALAGEITNPSVLRR